MDNGNWTNEVAELVSRLEAIENVININGDELTVAATFLEILMGRKVKKVENLIAKLFSIAPLGYRNRLKFKAGSDCEVWLESNQPDSVLVLRDLDANPNENLVIHRWPFKGKDNESYYYYYAKFLSNPAFKTEKKEGFPYDPNSDKFLAFIFDPGINGRCCCPGVEESLHSAFTAIGWIRRFALHIDHAR